MNKVYLVKSFGPVDGYMNLKVFDSTEKAESYAKKIESMITVDSNDEFVEIEELTLE